MGARTNLISNLWEEAVRSNLIFTEGVWKATSVPAIGYGVYSFADTLGDGVEVVPLAAATYLGAGVESSTTNLVSRILNFGKFGRPGQIGSILTARGIGVAVGTVVGTKVLPLLEPFFGSEPAGVGSDNFYHFDRYEINKAAAQFFGSYNGVSEADFLDGHLSPFSDVERFQTIGVTDTSPDPSGGTNTPRFDRLIITDRLNGEVFDVGWVESRTHQYARNIETNEVWVKENSSPTWVPISETNLNPEAVPAIQGEISSETVNELVGDLSPDQPPVERHCFPAGTPILMGDGSEKDRISGTVYLTSSPARQPPLPSPHGKARARGRARGAPPSDPAGQPQAADLLQ